MSALDNEIGPLPKPFLEGRLVHSSSEATIDVINPSNGKRLFQLPVGCTADVDRAVESARHAFESGCWNGAPPGFRKSVLRRLADLVAAESVLLDRLDAGEMGKPVSTVAFNAAGAAGFAGFNAESVDKITGDVYVSDKNTFVVQRRRPRGVIAAVVPWNFPTFNALLKVAPALAAGNCVVLKPSELASRSAMRIADLALRAGLPPGVLNVVPGLGERVGRALGLHSDIDMLAFTGSTAVGKLLLQYAGQSNMKVVAAECGGKSPQIIFDDGVNLDAAAASIAAFLLTNQGQICSVGSRLLVQRSIEPLVLEKVIAQLTNIEIGDALNPKTTFGPLASARQMDRVLRYIDGARSEGAQLVVGGRRVLEETGGYFVEPTVFRNVSPGARIAQEEVFGPVLSVIPFEDEAEAIDIANGTAFGLAAYVWTADLSTGMRLANGIQSMVFINAVSPKGEGAGYAASWEPVGQSGVGAEGGLPGIESYMVRQLVWFNHG